MLKNRHNFSKNKYQVYISKIEYSAAKISDRYQLLDFYTGFIKMILKLPINIVDIFKIDVSSGLPARLKC